MLWPSRLHLSLSWLLLLVSPSFSPGPPPPPLLTPLPLLIAAGNAAPYPIVCYFCKGLAGGSPPSFAMMKVTSRLRLQCFAPHPNACPRSSLLAWTGILFVKETIDRRDVMSTGVTLFGVLMTTFFGPHVNDAYDADSISKALSKFQFHVFIFSALSVLAVGWILSRSERPQWYRILLYAYTAALSGSSSMLLLKVDLRPTQICNWSIETPVPWLCSTPHPQPLTNSPHILTYPPRRSHLPAHPHAGLPAARLTCRSNLPVLHVPDHWLRSACKYRDARGASYALVGRLAAHSRIVRGCATLLSEYDPR